MNVRIKIKINNLNSLAIKELSISLSIKKT